MLSPTSLTASWQLTGLFGSSSTLGEGKCDILEFENVGMNGSVQVSGLDLGSLSACFITLRAWKLDGRCTELSVKAHALKGQHCARCWDGFVTITRGESIRRFFEHAEEAEEEEDDDSMDKDGNELDGECSRPQKHAKSPELAREFLLDAATVIFKEQACSFWGELSQQARQELLRIDKQTLFEQARKNMYCSRCNGLLLEGFLQIVMYGKSLQQEGAGGHVPCNRQGALKTQNNAGLNVPNGCHDEIQDPSVHPWGV
ncbi:hypothetical protein CFP56_015407 [Quercus suber]|uniref:Uncharacterized protein n=1 Tax=Quercus suber TaxID=58331 RepID=A0AAW0KRZ5_QUESU